MTSLKRWVNILFLQEIDSHFGLISIKYVEINFSKDLYNT